MKTRIFILFGLIIIALASCDLTNESNYTPQMYIASSHYNSTDTLSVYLTDEGGVYRLDTINVGDTVLLGIYLYGATNNLTHFYLTQSDTVAAKIILPVEISMDSVFSKTQSDYAKGDFVFLPKQTYVCFPIRCVAQKASDNAMIQFTLYSDASFDTGLGSNAVSIKLKIPIVEVPDSIQ